MRERTAFFASFSPPLDSETARYSSQERQTAISCLLVPSLLLRGGRTHSVRATDSNSPRTFGRGQIAREKLILPGGGDQLAKVLNPVKPLVKCFFENYKKSAGTDEESIDSVILQASFVDQRRYSKHAREEVIPQGGLNCRSRKRNSSRTRGNSNPEECGPVYSREFSFMLIGENALTLAFTGKHSRDPSTRPRSG